MNPPAAPFDNRQYWESRLREHYSLAGVGYLRLGRRFNEWMYRIRGEVDLERPTVERAFNGIEAAGLEAAGKPPALIWEAAALFESLAMNHPFLDGNKRIAFAAVDVFLRVSGWRIRAKPMTIHRWMIGHLEAGSFTIANIEPWLRKHVAKAGG